MKKWYYTEWKIAEKEGNNSYANSCKEQYRLETMKQLIKCYHMYHEKLKMFPLLNLN